jgi:hypothetical protein
MADEEEKIEENKKEPEKVEEPELLEDLPNEIKRVVEIGMSMQRFSGAMPSPIASKINEKHIDKILEIASKDSENSHLDKNDKRKYTLYYTLIGVIVFCILTYFLITNDKDDLYKDVLKMLFAFVGGFGGGVGYKTLKDKD